MRNNDSLIFSLYGALFEQAQFGLSLKTLCSLLGCLGLSAEASRLALSRMARHGSLHTRRKGRSSFYFLTDSGLACIRSAESRSLYRGEPAEWDGKFRLLSYEIPEALRKERTDLASVLRSAGFGHAASGLWVSAAEPCDAVTEFIEGSALKNCVDFYVASHVGDSQAFAFRVWKLSAHRDALDAFIATWSERRDDFLRCQSSGAPLADEECFARYFEALDDFLGCMMPIPPVPRALLPPEWPAQEAHRLFVEYRKLVHDGASDFFDSVYEAF